ncbi:polymerase (RNA) iii (DNA directed) polypeptide d, 44kda [Plakobranchus ocellatus]|uniref:Polymerase (RNA) iii (DNA directed) polypeptide d, 44kda n=1 Tax=Plakobranchus ocellatus TaxID=259542 RepID=A0AAV3Y8X8_9GAST|nr:polymerase (RNA) iii (DNA directed) polypeptide d, 44kda [Plakobranchus ocellatus]
MAPIKLPLNLNNAGIKTEVKTEIKVEPMDVEGIKRETLEFPATAPAPSSPASFKDILFNKSKSESDQLLVLQFPDTLPGLPASVLNEARPGPSSSSVSASQENELSQQLGACQLKDCPEGFMGKLRLRKSGKVELVLGDNIMEVLPGLDINFHQELVSVRTNGSTGQMVALGPVDHKLVVTPDYNHLITQISSFK